jgi:glycosyltransferase involved in cell wall biosynthesis
MDGLDVHRFRYAPNRFERLAYDGGIPTRLRRHPWLALLLPSFLVAQITAAFRLARSDKPTVIHAHWLIPGGLVGAALKKLISGRQQLLVTAHGADVHLTGPRPIAWLKRLAIESADSATVVSRALGETALTLATPDTTIEVVPMGVDLQTRFTPGIEKVDDPVLVFAGRLVAKKGVADLIQATPRVLSKIPNARLMIAGHGPLEDELQSMAKRLSICHAVEFLGSIPNRLMPDVLRKARLAVLPFRTAANGDVEGLGLAAIEAMGCGLPVIVGDVPAIRDVVCHARTGWVVPPDSADQLADAIAYLLSNPEISDRLGAAGRQFAIEHFDWTVAATRYREILLALTK